jgi:hypothetical protein
MNKFLVTKFILVSIAVIALSLLYFLYPATNTSFYPACIFHSLTGLYCPGCGSQRAASALLHGDLSRAIGLNILFVLCIPLIVYSGFVYTWNIFNHKKMHQAIFYSPIFIKIFLGMVLLFWVLRNIPTAPFKYLAP